MTLTELKYIVAVAREAHFGRAAEACFVSQPTLSVAVKKLEEELGITLFERGKSEVRITDIGERIVEQAARVLSESENIKQIAFTAKDPLAGPLRLGAIYTIGPYILPSLIPNLRAMAPQMPMILQEDFTANLRVKLRRGELDVILIALPFEEQGVEVMPLYQEPFEALLPQDHSLCKKELVNAEDMSKENLLLLGEGHCFRDQVLEVCPSRQVLDSTHTKVEGTSLETLRHMVASGMGVTILPSSALGEGQYDTNLLVARPFCDPKPSRVVALAWRSSFPRPQAIEVVRKAILQCEPIADLKTAS
ncbi:hydrogen peroxide-inducible genes activator [Pelagibaculum spongiae]|uniref:LysR family transcriptional regulator n=1 Tax=Pelagibaculum spongiae TaxID=2080658 RepID=A0A2V1GWD8_9GAMM|nr:hydrogen peroxide-inducible genes activator [Pelagibaculum spongiae]PVZ70648.1 LysR family transcriptional regulator [Pelagibaculum spongiae]